MKYLNLLSLLLPLICFRSNIGAQNEIDDPDLSIHLGDTEPCVISIVVDHPVDSLPIHIEYDDYLLMDRWEQDLVCLNIRDTSVQLKLRKPELVRISLMGKEIPVFSFPGLQERIILHIESNRVTHLQLEKYQSISEYFSTLGRTLFTSSDGAWEDIEKMIKNENLRKVTILDSLQSRLPTWFFRLQKRELEFDYYGHLFSGYTYRNHMLGYKDSLPIELISILDTVNLISSESYLSPGYSSTVYAKLLRPELESQKYFDSTFTNVDRHRVLLERIKIQTTELSILSVKAIRNYLLHVYCRMNRSSRHYPEDLLNSYLFELDTVRRQLALSVFESKMSLLNKPAPNFVLKTPDGSYINLTDLKGKPIWISFWFTGCKPCIKEFPAENKLVEKYADTDMQFISICTISNETDWKKMIIEHGLRTTNLFANENWSRILSERYNITSYPKWLLIDREGKIIQEKLVSPGDPSIESWIERVL